jgi:cytochrome c
MARSAGNVHRCSVNDESTAAMRLPARAFLMVSAMLALAVPAIAAPVDPVFAPCAACHRIEKGKNGLGPSLYRIVGRNVGAVAKFSYSDAMKAKGGVWTEEELDRYLSSPKTAIPGNRMSFPGYKDPVKRAAVIAYLKTLK